MQQQGRSEGPLHDLVQERTASLSGYLQRQNRTLAESPWQLVQVLCTCSRGYMCVVCELQLQFMVECVYVCVIIHNVTVYCAHVCSV